MSSGRSIFPCKYNYLQMLYGQDATGKYGIPMRKGLSIILAFSLNLAFRALVTC